ncbi:hypothetical protein [Phytohabitans suffuscus]|uniref:Uncharacterized protein n=1 Tax=Phytohabitans suffuscus TaxID=624315 RepID=A0A6F8YVI7_9ACTN|nr:hypothetical protein [Phytohabitans suffuscus]BCB90074.1 hypothetical protein Psuf_073870 [Phytohabitans suffuscus]
MTTDPLDSRTRRLVTSVERHPFVTASVPEHATVGWPLPFRKRYPEGPAAFVRLPIVPFRPVGPEGSELFAPAALLTVRWRDQRVVEFVDLRYASPWPDVRPDTPLGVFPHPQVRDSLRDYLADRLRLFARYDDLLDSLDSGRAAGPQREFAMLLDRLVEPGLTSFYRTLAPKFVDRFLPAPLGS